MNLFSQLIGAVGAGRMVLIGSIAIGLIVFFAFLTARLTAPQMALLYADLDLGDSSRIVAELESANIPYQIRANGALLMVPREQVQRLRMSLAQEGLPQGGSMGFEIFDRSDALGTTNFVQNINFVRALEGELARTIRSLDKVAAARVHLVLPRRELFSRESRDPSASIILRTIGAAQLDKGQVASIQHLVAAAVPKLSPTRISIVDDKGNLLARGTGEDDASGGNASLSDFQTSYESRLQQSVEALLERTVGIGKVRATITADMDFDRVTTSDETFDPDGQVVRSTQTIEESSSSIESDGQEPVSVGTNLPEAQAAQGAGAQSVTENARSEETVNFEISRTNRTQVHETGVVRRLSVAVLVDGTYTVAQDGTRTYNPRSDEELEQLASLVRSSVGFDQARGDSVEVINMQFAAIEIEDFGDAETAFLGLGKADYFKIAEFLVFIIVFVLVILLVVRPIVSRSMTIGAPEGALAEGLGEFDMETPALEGPNEEVAPVEDGMMDMAQVDGKVKASAVKKVGEIVDKHPDEALSIIRSWLYENV